MHLTLEPPLHMLHAYKEKNAGGKAESGVSDEVKRLIQSEQRRLQTALRIVRTVTVPYHTVTVP